MIRVLLADDQALVSAGFRVLIDADPDCEVVGEAADGARAVALAVESRPDVVLMDIRMPGMDGIEATRHIAADPRTQDVKVLVLTTFDLDEYVFEALRAGASGFLLKDTRPPSCWPPSASSRRARPCWRPASPAGSSPSSPPAPSPPPRSTGRGSTP